MIIFMVKHNRSIFFRALQLALLSGGCLLLPAASMAENRLASSMPSPASVLVPAPVSPPLQTVMPIDAPDPLEGYNRIVFRFNDALDNAILKPTARAYNAVLPSFIRTSIANFFNNVNTVPVLLNDTLQGNFYQATADAWRLFINTTVGIAGFLDVAKHIGLEPNLDEDLGLTFAHWGWTNSTYFILPFFGPSSIRDAVSKPIEYQFMTIYPYITGTEDRYLLLGLDIINTRAQLLKFENVVQQAAVDKYVFMRNSYIQHRAYLIKRNQELGDPYASETTSDYDMLDDADEQIYAAPTETKTPI